MPVSAVPWKLGLAKGLPRTLSQDGSAVAVPGQLVRISDFLVSEFPSFVESAILTADELITKAAFFSEVCDLIELRSAGKTIGVIIGEREDWSSYYVRVYAVSSGFQRPALTRRFGRECLFEPLAAAGIKRVFADTSPTNIPMVRGLAELHFFATGMNLSERYGPMTRYTKFLCPEAEASFVSKFSGTAPPR